MNFKLLVMVAMVFLGSCKEYDKIISDAEEFKKSHPEKRVVDGEIEPDIPNEKENNRTLLGVDANKNGIRDDIDIWINYVGFNYNHRMSLRQFAREEVKRLVAGASENTSAYEQVAKDFYDASQCAEYIEFGKYIGEKSPSSQIIQLTYNTAIRRKGYEQFHRSTLVYKSNLENLYTIEAYRACQFKIENLQDLIKKRK